MDSNRLRYKQVGSKFRSSDDSRAIRAINQEDGRRARRSHVLHIHRNIPETLSPEPSPSVMGVRPTKKALAAAAAIAKAKATIHKLAADDTECDAQIVSQIVASHHQSKDNASPVVKNSPRMRNTSSTTKTKATKPAKLIGGKTLEELRNERMERLKLYKQRKQRKQEREKAAKKPNFWLGVAKRDTKMLLLPSDPEPKGPRKLATPSKVQTPIWHSGFSVSKKQAPGGPTPFSTNKNRALKSSRNIFTNATPGVSTSSRAASTQLSTAARKPVAGRAGHERVHPNKNASFAPKDYKFLAPSGLQQVSARGPTPRRPSIRFSGTPPSITPPTSGPRRMPRTKTPMPATRTPARPSRSSASTESSSSSSDELPVNNLSGTSQGQETLLQKTSPCEVSEPSFSGSPMSPETESAKAKLSKRPSKRRASRSSMSNEVFEALMSYESSARASESREMVLKDENLERSSDFQNVSERQHSSKQSVQETNEESHSSSEEQKFSNLEVDNEEVISVTPPNTEFSFAVLADSIKKKSRERSISKVTRSASIKKSNLISKLNLSANESDESSRVRSPVVKTNLSFQTKSPFAQKTSSAENRPNLPKQHHSSSSSLSDENDLHLSSNKTLVSASSSNCLSPSPISSLVNTRTASRTNSSQKSHDRRPSAHKSSSGERSSVDASVRLTVPASDECGCSPDLQPRSKKRKSVMKVLTSANAGVGDATSSGAADYDPSTPAASAQLRRSMNVRRSVRLASVTSNAGDSDGGLRTPSHASQRTTATTPCSRSTRRSLAVHAASTWEEFCAATPQLPAPAKTPRRHRKTMADSDDVPAIEENSSPQSDEHHVTSKTPGRKGRRKTIADSDDVPAIEENSSPHPEHQVTSKTPGRKGRRKTIAANARSDVEPNEILSSQSERKAASKKSGRKGRRKTVISEAQNDYPQPDDLWELGKYAIPQLDREVSGTEDATAAAADVEQDQRTSLLDKVNGMHSISPDNDNQVKKRTRTPDCITPKNASTSAVEKFSEHTRKLINVTPAFSTQSASSGSGSSLMSSSPPTPMFTLEKKEVLSLSCGRQGGPISCSSSRRKIRPPDHLTASVKVKRLRSLSFVSLQTERNSSLSERRTPVQQSRRSSSARRAQGTPSEFKEFGIVMMYPSCSSSGASLSPGSSQLDVSQLPDESPFVNTESRARKRKKLALKGSSFMDKVHEDVLQSLQREEEVRDDEAAITPALEEDSTNPELAELLRPTTPCSPADVSINVWDEMSPMVDHDGGAEAKENEEPGRESKRRSIKSKRRSSLREGALLGALKARNESVPNSRPSLGFFAKGAPQSPVVIPANIAEGEDLISWESPKSAQQMHDGDVDQLRTKSPKTRSGSVRGRRVSRLAALYEQAALSPAPSPASPRRSTRLSHLTPLV